MYQRIHAGNGPYADAVSAVVPMNGRTRCSVVCGRR